MSSLVKLPYELLQFVVQHLDLADIRNLSLSCRRLQFLFHEPNITKAILQSKAPNTLEARTAKLSGRYAPELRRLVKRREAVASVSPYLAAIVAVAESWIYENGVLCHITERELRILDLHHSQSSELLVDIRELLASAIPESRKSKRFKFRLLYFSNDIISCLYQTTKPRPANYLVVFNAKEQRVLEAHLLDASFKIFVRNNDKFLFYGTYSPDGPDGVRCWVIRGFQLPQGSKPGVWFKQKLDLPEAIGSDIGSTISFEILNDPVEGDHFYGVSSQASLEDEEVDWMSYYTCFRFPLNSENAFQKIEHAPRKQLWRRWHVEGPIDDRWTFLRLFKDEATSELRIVESRKEWLARNSSARRTYYTTKVVFGGGSGEKFQSSSIDASLSETIRLAAASKCHEPDLMKAPPRDPDLVHPGDDNSTELMFTLSKSPIRCYHPSSQTFVDLVDDPPSFGLTQRVRIRGGSRRRWTPDEQEERSRLPAARRQPLELSPDTFDQVLADVYKHEAVMLWPPDQDPSVPDPALAALYNVLNPPTHFGNIRGSWDERSLIYGTGGAVGGHQALVFLSFDPQIHLKGIVPYHGKPTLDAPSGLPCEDSQTTSQPQLEASSQPFTDKGKEKETDTLQITSEPNSTCCPEEGTTLDSFNTGPGTASSASSPSWRKFKTPMYESISRGFHFGLCRSC
ncbi:hypothetical protein B0H67DRAFT_485618 [Lasiosphaeris hirsuta]|uniref:F-box domain-containing protein n=1 Tax=Lasiosphaeris hirsuta TaxID=260670 RepID=A0AA40APH6_9PEZI|nr:hypothetical protein B0H67DRAFT_485618 [Lasiosphaeris hirsuta]